MVLQKQRIVRAEVSDFKNGEERRDPVTFVRRSKETFLVGPYLCATLLKDL